MPRNNETFLIDTIKWLNDIGCDEVLNINKRSFYGVISNLDNINVDKAHSEVSGQINFEKIENINSLEQYLLTNKIILDSNILFYEGIETADLMVIGDKYEDRIIKNKKPFEGEVGILLDAMLKAISFDKTNTYFTNLHFGSSNIDKNLALKIIKKQISIVKPKIIIMFGAEVTKALSNTEDSIFHSRGKWYNINIGDNLETFSGISMFHPRYLLGNKDSKKEAWEDLKAVRNKLT